MSSPMFASKVLTSLGMKKEFYEIATRNKCYKKGFIKYGEKTDKQ
jgi:hypothetical protein